MAESLQKQVVKGVLWRLASRFSTQGVTFFVGIILARMLGPEVYGTIAILTIFISISDVLVNCGFGASLIQKKEITELDLNSVFYLQISLSLLLYGVLYFSAPLIASFYRNSDLIDILRVQSLILPINAIRGIQSSVLSRNLWFKYSFRIGLAEVFSSGIVGLSMAYLGYGVWALVWSALARGFAGMVSAVWWVRWVPKLLFSISSIKTLFGYGWKLLVSGFIDSVFADLYGLVIGRFYTPKDLALYNRGRQFPFLAMDTINSSLSIVAFPALSKLQTDPVRMRDAMRKMIQVSTFFVMPMLAGMSAIAEPLVSIVLGEKWLESVPYVVIACVGCSFYPFHTINLQAVKASGRSDYYLKLSIVKDVVCVVVLAISCRYSVVVMALAGALVSTPASLLINSWPNKILFKYSIFSQLYDITPTLLISTFMAIATWGFRFISPFRPLITMGLQIVIGVVLYYALILLFKPVALGLILEGVPFVRRLFPPLIRK